jgi:hypothetical protein
VVVIIFGRYNLCKNSYTEIMYLKINNGYEVPPNINFNYCYKFKYIYMTMSWIITATKAVLTTHVTLSFLFMLEMPLRKSGFTYTANFIYRAYMTFSEPINSRFAKLLRFISSYLIQVCKWFQTFFTKFILTPLRRYSSFRKIENYAVANWSKYIGKHFKKKPTYADVILSTKFKFKW